MTRRFLRALLPILALSLVASSMACEEKLPTKMVLRPKGPLRFENTGKKETVELAFFDDKSRPYVRKPDASFESLDPSVATVESQNDGTRAVITPKSSGKTDVVVNAFGLEERITVEVSLVGSVEIDEKTPSKMKVLGTPHQLVIVVKDDRGNVIENPRANFSTNHYCVDVSPDGLVTPQAAGDCQVTVDVAGKVDRHVFNVR